MAPTMTTARSRVLPEVAERHRVHRDRLLLDRAFRLEQLADLEVETSGTPSHSGVRSALRIAGTTALREIDAALERMAAGVYGVCVACQGPIPEERLDALPMAPLCTPCHYNEQNCRISRRLDPPA